MNALEQIMRYGEPAPTPSPLPFFIIRCFIFGLGSFFAIEAAANLVYWRNDKHPFLFQLGRGLRLILGISLMALSVIA